MGPSYQGLFDHAACVRDSVETGDGLREEVSYRDVSHLEYIFVWIRNIWNLVSIHSMRRLNVLPVVREPHGSRHDLWPGFLDKHNL